VDTRNTADHKFWQTEKQINELNDKIDEESKQNLQAGIDRLKDILKGADLEAIKSASDDLDTVWQEVSTKMYKNVQQQQADQAQQQGAGGPGPDMGGAQQESQEPEVENADFEVVDDDDKK
jgi:molecular chaperone DnaK